MRLESRATAPLVGLVLASLASDAGAQSTEQERVAATACTYDRCALRIDGVYLLQGLQSQRVGRVDPLFKSRLTQQVAGSDSALAYMRVFERDYPRGARIMVVGAIVSAPALIHVLKSDLRNIKPSNAQYATLAAGVIILNRGSNIARRGTEALSKSVWWYNRDLPR